MLTLLFALTCCCHSIESRLAALNFSLPPFGRQPQIAIETVPVNPAHPNSIYPVANDCSTETVNSCNQGAWTNFGLALSGLTPKNDLCRKYSPASSCVSTVLALCMEQLDENTKMMLLSLARIVVSWCSDSGEILDAMGVHSECYSVVLLDSITSGHCLSEPVPPHTDVNINTSPSHQKLPLEILLKDFADSDHSRTLLCFHQALTDACGSDAADLALGAAVNQIREPLSQSQTSSQTPVKLSPVVLSSLAMIYLWL